MNNEELLNNYYKEIDEKMRVRYLDLMLLEGEEPLSLIIKNIKQNKEIRSNAYALNILSKKKKVQEYLEENLTLSTLLILLDSEDSKVRKNAYIMLGNLHGSHFGKLLLEALDKETVYYCLSSVILSLGNYKIGNIENILRTKSKDIDVKLANNEIEKKQYDDIKNNIEKVLLKSIEFNKHEFIGFKEKRDVFLTIMPALRNACLSEIRSKFKEARLVKEGIVVSTNDYSSVFNCRTFYEAMMCDKNGFNIGKDKVINYIENMLRSGFVSSCHKDNDSPFYYRIEVKSTQNKQRKLDLINRIKDKIDASFNCKYINNPSLYEFEIRVVEKEEKYDVFFKLYTVEDKRFDYRVTDLPASINPTTASILMQEIKGYLKDDSEVLDAFCGTSTMLIERSFVKGYKSLTGIDISQEAVEYSKINANNVPLKIELIWENILKYEGLEFDEIISNMPFGNRVSNHELNITLYRKFIAKLDGLLKDNGMAFLLTSEIGLMKELISKNKKLKLVKNIYVESGGLKPHLFVIKKIA